MISSAVSALLVILSYAVEGPFASVTVDTNGVIRPIGFVAANSNLTTLVTENQITGAKADAVSAAQALLDARLAAVEASIAQRELVAYIRDYARNYGYGLAPRTNIVSSIIRSTTPYGNDGTNCYVDVYNHFSADPGNYAVHGMKYISTLNGTNAWSYAPVISYTATSIMIGSTNWGCYKYVVKMPSALASAFLKTYTESFSQVGSGFFPIKNGIEVDGVRGISATFASGASTVVFTNGLYIGTEAGP
jgi:hypothetical protein